MVDSGNLLFTLIPHFVLRGSVGLTMKLASVVLISLGCVSGAVGFGFVANAAIDLVLPPPKPVVVQAPTALSAPKTLAAPNALSAPKAAPVEAAAGGPAPGFALASATSTPVDISPVRVKTIPMLFREDSTTELAAERPAASPAAERRIASVPVPRPRPASAPSGAMAMDSTASISGQPGSLAISAATSKAAAHDGDPLSPAGIDRMRTALALTAEQEEFWPAIAAELRTIGKMMSHKNGQKAPATKIDNETIQRLYWAAAPLITRLSYEQKLKAKQMARLMGLTQVAEAL
jgi:hypothetical protein